MVVSPWRRYLTHLCVDAWRLDALATVKVVERIEALEAAQDLSDSTVAGVLRRAGLVEPMASRAAGQIRGAITGRSSVSAPRLDRLTA